MTHDTHIQRCQFIHEKHKDTMQYPETHTKFQHGQTVRKTKGSNWHGVIVGWYSTELTPEGYAVESSTERGSVQIYPAAALEDWPQ